jgi:hypothetical protein
MPIPEEKVNAVSFREFKLPLKLKALGAKSLGYTIL